jgi:hypothetical protein
LGPKGLRRSWGWGTGGSGGGGGDGEEKEGGDHRRRGDAVAVAGEVKAPVRSSSVSFSFALLPPFQIIRLYGIVHIHIDVICI